MDSKQVYRVWVEVLNTKSVESRWEAVTPKVSQATAEVIKRLYEMEYPDKTHSVSISEPRSFNFKA